MDDDGARRLRKKEEVENPSGVLLNPSDPEATFRYKAGKKNLGYVGNIVESVGKKEALSRTTHTRKIYMLTISL